METEVNSEMAYSFDKTKLSWLYVTACDAYTELFESLKAAVLDNLDHNPKVACKTELTYQAL